MARSKTGEAISARRRSRTSREALERFTARAKQEGRLDEWRRGRAVLCYLDGKRVVDIAEMLDVTRGSVNRWLGWYDDLGLPGLKTIQPPGVPPKLSDEQREELSNLIDAGPIAAGYSSGVWTGPMIADLIDERFGYRFHNHSVPALLNKLGFSVQRPRKRLARADLDAQANWLRKRLPAIKKKAAASRGIVMFEDEASFWLDGTLHRTWSRVGVQPRVDTFGERKTAHVFGAISAEHRPRFVYQFADKFNGKTFLAFLKEVVRRCPRRKVFMIIDNGPCHWLDADGKEWLHRNRHRIELHRLPPYSPELNPIEGVWKQTKKTTTHNRFYRTVEERDDALTATFESFKAKPNIVAGHVARFV